ncbi:MAG: hypothetical protein QOI57_3355, partial [Rubrobacteraceae bacterium]|nr:hypothetical protein [Rubrobacteraceae bacterium]
LDRAAKTGGSLHGGPPVLLGLHHNPLVSKTTCERQVNQLEGECLLLFINLYLIVRRLSVGATAIARARP